MDYTRGFSCPHFLLCLANRGNYRSMEGGREVKKTGCVSHQAFIMMILLKSPRFQLFTTLILLWAWGLAVVQLILPGLSWSLGFKLGLYLLIFSYSGT